MAVPTKAILQNLQKQGKAMPPSKPGGKPKFYIRNKADLQNAIDAVGRVRPNTDAARAAVRRHIMANARTLGFSSMIPDTWQADGSLKSGATS
jgi:hypothetical protein